MKNLKGKRILVTGAASGIGLECARSFARRGAHLVISDVNVAALEKARAGIVALGAECLAHSCDVSREESVREFAAAVHGAVGAIDVLVNNAGVAFLGSFEETPLEEWRRIYDINVLGIVHCIRAFLPPMQSAGGERKIVNVASTAGFAPMPNMAAYAASKHAVVGLSEVLAMELHGTGVSVLVVCPGIINTAIVHVSPISTGIGPAQKERLQRYYATDGCTPDVVAEDIVRSVEKDDAFLFTGPLAKLGYAGMRISRRLARRLAIATAKKSGYLPE
jgi:NAD(P)-dependent dehydrogenase (short-subunit alcohol dehydrogenase family)